MAVCTSPVLTTPATTLPHLGLTSQGPAHWALWPAAITRCAPRSTGCCSSRAPWSVRRWRRRRRLARCTTPREVPPTHTPHGANAASYAGRGPRKWTPTPVAGSFSVVAEVLGGVRLLARRRLVPEPRQEPPNYAPPPRTVACRPPPYRIAVVYPPGLFPAGRPSTCLTKASTSPTSNPACAKPAP